MDNLDSKLIKRFEEIYGYWCLDMMISFHNNVCMLTSLERAQLVRYCGKNKRDLNAVELAYDLLRSEWRYTESDVIEHSDFEAI